MKKGEIRNMLPEYVMSFHPPLIVQNLLPFEITVKLLSSKADKDPPSFTVGAGECLEVYQFDMSHKIRMHVDMQVL